MSLLKVSVFHYQTYTGADPGFFLKGSILALQAKKKKRGGGVQSWAQYYKTYIVGQKPPPPRSAKESNAQLAVPTLFCPIYQLRVSALPVGATYEVSTTMWVKPPLTHSLWSQPKISLIIWPHNLHTDNSLSHHCPSVTYTYNINTYIWHTHCTISSRPCPGTHSKVVRQGSSITSPTNSLADSGRYRFSSATLWINMKGFRLPRFSSATLWISMKGFRLPIH